MHISILFFFFNDTATTEIYTLPYTTLFRSAGPRLVDPVPAGHGFHPRRVGRQRLQFALDGGYFLVQAGVDGPLHHAPQDRKSTRLNSSHANISYAVFCLKKKIKQHTSHHTT